MTTTEISVNHEWGTLKEAIVGTAESMRIPLWSDEYVFLTADIQQFIKTNQGKFLRDADSGVSGQTRPKGPYSAL